MDSSGMWSLHYASVVVATTGEFTFSTSESSVMFAFTTTGRSHFPYGTCLILLPRDITDGLVDVIRRDVVMTGIFRRLWAPARQMPAV